MSGLVGVHPAAMAPTVEEFDFHVATQFFRNNLRCVTAIGLSVLIHGYRHAFDARPFHAVKNVHILFAQSPAADFGEGERSFR